MLTFGHHQLVRLKYDTVFGGGSLLPAGSVGMVLQTYADGFLVNVQFLDFRGLCVIPGIELELVI